MKKFLLTAFLTIVLLCTVCATVSASHGFEVNLSELENVEAGQNVTVVATVDNITVDGGIESIDFLLKYSDTVTYSSTTATLPEGWTLWTPTSDTTERTLKIAAVDEGEGAEVTPAEDDGDITFTFTFAVASDYADGDRITVEFIENITASAANTYKPVTGIGDTLDYYVEPNVPEYLTVTSLPRKIEYSAGSVFRSNGLAVSVTYTDGTVVDVTDFTVEDPDMMTEGKKDVKVTWGALTTTFQILITAPSLSSITLTLPTKTSYYVGDTINTAGMVVIANYANNTTADVTADATVTPQTFTSTGTITVTVKYSTKSATFTVTVTEKPVSENLGEGTIGTSITWVVELDGTLRISGEGMVPDYGRTSDQAPWYGTRSQIKAVVVEEGITGLGNYALLALSKATSVELASSVKYIGQFTFREIGLTEFTIDHDMELSPYALARMDNLQVLNIAEGVKSFMGNVFTAKSAQTITVKAPENSFAHKYVEMFATKYPSAAELLTLNFEANGTATAPIVVFESAGENAFYAIYEKNATTWALEVTGRGAMKNYPYISQKSIDKGYKLTPMYYICEKNVKDEQKIQSITVCDGVTTLGNYAFYKCNKATSLVFPDDITLVGAGALWACAKIKTINIPETVTKIDKNAFNGCANLTTITIPDSVTEFGAGVFVKCNFELLTVYTNNQLVIDTLTAEYGDTINIQQLQ